MKTHVRAPLAVTLSLLLALAACGGSADEEPSASAPPDDAPATADAPTDADSEAPDEEMEPVSLNVGYIDTSINGGGVIAIMEDQGLFDKYALDATLIPFTNGPTQIQAMQSGDVDVGYIGGGAVWLPASGQATIIATSEASIGERVIASADSGATDMEGLAGLRVGLPEGGSGEMILALALDDAGMTMDDIEPVVLDPPSIVTAFASDSIDAAAIFMPLAQQILDTAPDATIVAQNTDFPGTEFLGAWVAANSAIDEKPEELTRFLMAYADANDFRVDNFDDAVALSSAFTGVPEDATRVQGEFVDWYPSDVIGERDADGTTYEQFENLEEIFVTTNRMDQVNPGEDFINVDLFADALSRRG